MRFDSRARSAFIVACLTLLACSAAFNWAVRALNVYLEKRPVGLRDAFSTIPRSLGPWRSVGEDQILDDAGVEQLGTRQYLSRVYALEGDPAKGALSVHVAYYTGMIDAVPHIPERCFVAAGYEDKSLPRDLALALDQRTWEVDTAYVNLRTGRPYPIVRSRHPITWREMVVRMPVGDLELRTTEFEDLKQPGIRFFGGYLFIANGRATSTAQGVRMMAFDRSERYAYYCKVQFVAGGRELTPEAFADRVSGFMNEFLPELMLRLPDWAEVERREEPIEVTPQA